MITAKYIKALYWYDGPIFALMKTSNCRLMLAMWVDDVDAYNTALYLGVEASYKRVRAVENNCTTIREAFRFPEYYSYYTLTLMQETNLCTRIDREDIPLNWYSKPGARLIHRG